MNITEYQQMAMREETYWWHLGRIKLIESLLDKPQRKKLKILNIGCGTGGTVGALEKYGQVTNVDISEEALSFLRSKGYAGIKVDDEKLPFKDKSFDLIVALDVLEHIDEDRAALDEWRRVLKPKGKLLVTVPAFQSLWSGHDISLHHMRRYTTRNLSWDMKKSQFKADKLSYFYFFSFPLVAGFRFINKALRRKMNEHTSYVDVPKYVNSTFVSLAKIEAYTLKKFNLPLGTSVIGIFSKND